MLGLFAGKLIFEGALYSKEFCVTKWVGLDNKNSLNTRKQPKTASTNSPWVYIREGLLSEGFLRLRFGGAYFWDGLFFFGGGGWGGGVVLSEFYGMTTKLFGDFS